MFSREEGSRKIKEMGERDSRIRKKIVDGKI